VAFLDAPFQIVSGKAVIIFLVFAIDAVPMAITANRRDDALSGLEAIHPLPHGLNTAESFMSKY
jgi:hypothetical protein